VGESIDRLVDAHYMDVWGSSLPGTVDVLVKTPAAAQALSEHFGSCSVRVADVEAHVSKWEKEWEDETVAQNAKQMVNTSTFDPVWFSNYRNYADIVTWYRNFAASNPTIVRVQSIGTSQQGRDQPVVILTENTGARKPAFYIQCLIHAREWISGATCNFLLWQFVEQYKANDALARRILRQAEIHLVPFTNPDGYVWSWTNARLWRKSRNPNTGSTCIGTDLNRNYNDNWGRGGSSTDPCSDTFMGRAPADAPEVRNTAGYYERISPVIGAIDMHAYSQLILRPYGWSTGLSPDEARLNALGVQMQTAIRNVNARTYTNQRSIQLYITTGSAGDWFYGAATPTNGGFRAAAYTFELRPAGANPGFQLPPAEIIPQGNEMYQAFRVFLDEVERNPIRL